MSGSVPTLTRSCQRSAVGGWRAGVIRSDGRDF
jgi:hypothetical protein